MQAVQEKSRKATASPGCVAMLSPESSWILHSATRAWNVSMPREKLPVLGTTSESYEGIRKNKKAPTASSCSYCHFNHHLCDMVNTAPASLVFLIQLELCGFDIGSNLAPCLCGVYPNASMFQCTLV